MPERFRPSSLPALRQCGMFEPSQRDGAEDKDAGTERHEVLADLLRQPGQAIEHEDIESIEWAADYIRTHAPTSDHEMHIERKMALLDPEFDEVIAGTPDAVCGGDLFDFKWRRRDYGPQMAAYALMAMEENGRQEMRVHVLYGQERRAEVYIITRHEAALLLAEIAAKVTPNPVATPCDYCGWCARRLTCEPLLKMAQAVTAGYADLPEFKSWHPSQMETAEEISKALLIWRAVLKKWGESLEYHALEAVTKRGFALPSFDLKSKRGKTWCQDIQSAINVAGLTQEQFLPCCEVRLNSSKRTGALGLIDQVAKVTVQPKAAVKRELTKKLTEAGALKEGAPTQYLKTIKSIMEDDEDADV